MAKKAVVLFSGGLDSTVTAYKAREEGYELALLTFLYGQRNQQEFNSAEIISSRMKPISRVVIELQSLSKIMKSALLGDSEVPVDSQDKKIAPTWVPQRNSIFLSYAFAYAETIEADAIFTGFTGEAINPDRRPIYVSAIEAALNLASKRFVEENIYTRLIVPLLYMDKVDVLKLGFTLGAPIELTWSCYNNFEKACGICSPCRGRERAFTALGLKDPAVHGDYR